MHYNLMGLLGAHISIAGGLEKTFKRGEALGCQAIQIFSKNQRQWKTTPLSSSNVQLFKTCYRQSSICSVTIHNSYLINLASPDDAHLHKSREAFLEEIKRAEQLGADYLVFHPGSHMGTSEKEGLNRVAESINWVLRNEEGSVKLLVEITAGMGSSLGYRFEHLSEIIHQGEYTHRLGICFDTAHAFEAGYDIRTCQKYKETFKQLDQTIGLNHVLVFHLNDSKTSLASRTDRHENIGKGFLGFEPFRFLLNDKQFQNCPMILETPGGDLWFKENMRILLSLIKN